MQAAVTTDSATVQDPTEHAVPPDFIRTSKLSHFRVRQENFTNIFARLLSC
jgi:hypothetical protein